MRIVRPPLDTLSYGHIIYSTMQTCQAHTLCTCLVISCPNCSGQREKHKRSAQTYSSRVQIVQCCSHMQGVLPVPIQEVIYLSYKISFNKYIYKHTKSYPFVSAVLMYI